MPSTNPQSAHIGARAMARRSPIRALLENADHVGGVYQMSDFHEVLVTTNDAWLRDAYGVPQHAFLLASVPELADPATAGATPAEDEEVLLLRVIGSAKLPSEIENQALRERASFDLT